MKDVGLGRFGDKRLAAVGDTLLAAMQKHRTLCLHRLAEDRNQAIQFGRFLDNPEVTTGEMLAAAGWHTGARAGGRHILAIADTTELHFPRHGASKRGFGKAGNGEDIGLFLHPVLAVDATEGGIVGLVDCQIINRTGGKASERRGRGAEEKESRRWLHGAEIAAERLDAAARITVVADRESDIYDFMVRRPPQVDLLIRSAQDRALADGTLLAARVASWPEQGRSVITVPPRIKRAAKTAAARLGESRAERQALVALRFGAVTLKRAQTQAARDLPDSVALWAVDVRELDAPPGAEPVHWRLLTTHAVSTLAEAHQVVGWYRMRWTIEQVFRALKSHGLRIEDSQMEEACGFTKLAIIALIAAVRSMQLVLARDGRTGQPISDAADPADLPALRALNDSLQGRTAKLKNPHAPSSLAWFAWIVARLGGWSGYASKGYKPPGPKTMHHGLLRLDPILAGWRLAQIRSAHV